MFLIGLSSSFIPYLLLIGFMLVSFVKLNLNSVDDVELIHDNSNTESFFYSSDSDSSPDVYYWSKNTEDNCKNNITAIALYEVCFTHSASRCNLSFCKWAIGLLQRNSYFGLSPPSIL